MAEKREKECRFYCTSEEKIKIEELTEKSQLSSFSEYVRLSALSEKKKMIVEVEKEKKDYDKYILLSVNRALSNINQISKKLNCVENEKSIIAILKNYETMLSEAVTTLQKIKGDLL